MANRIASAALQYSKWLSRFICWVWASYRFLILVVSVIQPASSAAVVSTISGIDTIMLVNVGTYLVNSIGEKYIYSDRFVLSWLKQGGFNSLVSKLVKVEETVSEETVSEESEEGESDEYSG